MCGICGFYEYQSRKPANQEVLRDMLGILHHRGPDDSGAHFDSDLALGMRRLSIIDLSGGKQPEQGFPMPTSQQLRKEARAFMRDVLSPSALKQRGLFQPLFVERLMSEHERGFADHCSLLWGLMNVELWQRIFMDSPVRREHASQSLAPQLA